MKNYTSFFFKNYQDLHFQFPAFPVEMKKLEMQVCILKALVLLEETGITPFPVSKIRFHKKPLFFNAFRFPGIVYKYIYVGNTVHIYLICKNWPRKLSRRRPA